MTYARMTTHSRSNSRPLSPLGILGGGLAVGMAMFLTPQRAAAQDFENAVAGDIGKREMSLLQVNHYLSEGDNYLEEGDLARAFTNFRKAFELVPVGDSGDPFRVTAKQRYGDATVAYAEKLVDMHRQKEARLIIDEVLNVQRVPDHEGAKEMQNRLADPEWVPPGKTAAHMRKVDDVTRALGEGHSLLEMGEFDEATTKFAEVLNTDETNTAAREGLIKASHMSRNYRDAAYDQARAKLLDDLAAKWEYTDPSNGESGMRPKETPELGSLQDAPLSESIARKLASITIPEVNLQGMTIEPVVRYLEQLSKVNDPSGAGVNFVLSSAAGIDRARPITMTMKTVPLLVLVQYVTEFVGAKFRIDQFAVEIVPQDEQDTTMISRSFTVRPDFFTSDGGGASDDPFGDSAQVNVVSETAFLEQNGVSFPEGANAQYLPLSNKLTVRNTLSNLDLIENLVSSASGGPQRQIVIKVTTMDVRQENLEELGFDWLVGPFRLQSGNQVLGGGGSTVPAVETTGVLPNATNPNSDFAFTDPITGQVLGGDRVTSGIRSGPSAIGVDALEQIIGVDRETALSTNLAPGIFSAFGQMTDPQFQVVMRGLNQHTNSDIVTSPTVTVKPGNRARIESGLELIYPVEFDPPELPQEVSVGVDAGIFPVTPAHPTTFEMRPLGFTLEVEPAISPDGQMVDLALSPEFVEFIGFVNYGSPITAAGTDALGNPTNVLVTDNQILLPVFSSIRNQVNASVYDGSTLVIGGLSEERRDTIADKVPIVGDLPFVGRLFRGDVGRTKTRAVVIFVTVSIIDAQGTLINGPSSPSSIIDVE